MDPHAVKHTICLFHVGAFFLQFPRHRKLISVNKRYTGEKRKGRSTEGGGGATEGKGGSLRGKMGGAIGERGGAI